MLKLTWHSYILTFCTDASIWCIMIKEHTWRGTASVKGVEHGSPFWHQIKKAKNITLSANSSNIKSKYRRNRTKIDTNIHNRSLSWHGARTSIRNGGVKLVSWTQPSPFYEITWSSKRYFKLCDFTRCKQIPL